MDPRVTLPLPMSAYRFRPAPIPSITAAVCLAALVGLGTWQVQRAQDKRFLMAEEQERAGHDRTLLPTHIDDPEQWRYRRARVSGVPDGDRQFLLDNQIHEGRAGYHVLTPLRPTGGAPAVLIDRGWVLGNPDRSILPDVGVPSGRLVVDGVVYVPYSEPFRLGAMDTVSTWPRVIQYLDFDEMAHRLGYPIAPVVVRLDPESAHGFVRQWPGTPFSPERHLGYAIQWFALAAVLVVIFLAASIRKSGD